MIPRLNRWLRNGAWSVLLELALVAALAASLAHWTWVALAPRAVASSALAGESELPRSGPIVKRQLFGTASQGATAGAAPHSKLTLRGVAAPGARGTGRAVFKLGNGKSVTAAPGETIAPGVVLKEVHPDHVVVTRDGAIERIGLDRRLANLDARR